MDIEVIGVPVDDGASVRGCSMAPNVLISPLEIMLHCLGHTVYDGGQYKDLVLVSYAGTQALEAGRLPIFVGGDHSISMGSINGVARFFQGNHPLYVLWLDAHLDYNTPAISLTDNAHGMAAAYICGKFEFDDPLLGREIHVPVPLGRFHFYGTRTIDELEWQAIIDDKVQYISGDLESWLKHVQSVNGCVHLSFDVDVLSPDIAPGVGTPVPGGQSIDWVKNVMRHVRESGLLVSMDIVELNPLLDENGKTARAIITIIETLFKDEEAGLIFGENDDTLEPTGKPY